MPSHAPPSARPNYLPEEIPTVQALRRLYELEHGEPPGPAVDYLGPEVRHPQTRERLYPILDSYAGGGAVYIGSVCSTRVERGRLIITGDLYRFCDNPLCSGMTPVRHYGVDPHAGRIPQATGGKSALPMRCGDRCAKLRRSYVDLIEAGATVLSPEATAVVRRLVAAAGTEVDL